MLRDVSRLLENSNKHEFYIYGAGCWGNLFYQYCRQHDIEVGGYLVTKKGSQNITNGLPLYSFNEYVESSRDGQIVICMMYPQTVEEYLTEHGVSDYYSLRYEEILEIAKEISSTYFTEKDLLGASRTADLNGMKFVNPYAVDEMYFWEFFMSIIDIVLPSECNQYAMINEGPYFYGNVQLRSGDVVFDLGAGLGAFSQLALNKECDVYAFEPSPRNYCYLSIMNEVYSKERLHLVNEGIADYCGYHEFYTGGQTVGYDGFRQQPDLKEKLNVKVTTIDDFVQRHKVSTVDFIKVNIEGAERMMLRGATRTLQEFMPKLSIRTNHYEDDAIVLENMIKEINQNYVIEHKWKNLYAYVPRE